MRKVKLQMQVTIDGFVAGQDGEMDWMVWNWDEELKNYVAGITESIDCILLGRVLAGGFIDAWTARSAANPKNEDAEFARKMLETPKIIFSKTLEKVEWENTTLISENIAEEVKRLKQLPGKDIMLYGGARLVSAFIKLGLIDEYYLFVNPVALGNGMPIFNGLEEKLNLQLVSATPSACGIVVLCYESIK